jgi:hypothetical protein
MLFVIGFLLVFGAVGGMDAQPDADMVTFASQLGIAALGLLLMFIGAPKEE